MTWRAAQGEPLNQKGISLRLTGYLKQQFEGRPRQLRGGPSAAEGNGGFCTIGLLLESVRCPHLLLPNESFKDPALMEKHEKCNRRMAMKYDISYEEWEKLRVENTLFDWLTIAAMHYPEGVPGLWS